MIKFSLARLEKEPVELSGEEPPEMLDLGPTDAFRAVSPVKYRLRGCKVTGGVLVEGRVSARVQGECGRCLTSVVQKIECPSLALFFENPREEELDVTGDVREELLLQLPMALLCSEDCRGLCPECGANLNDGDCSCGGASPSGEDSGDGDENPWGALDTLNLPPNP